jgi:protein gp37
LFVINKTKIEYLDYTLNLEVGCSGVGCAVREKCWAKWQAKRQKHRCSFCYSFVPHLHMNRIYELNKLKKPSRIGLNFMGETFDKELPKCYVPSMLDVLAGHPQHTFLILTKQPQNIPDDMEFPQNLWLGVSVNRRQEKWRMLELYNKKCKLKFVSFEPLYEAMGDVDYWLTGFRWVIIGCQMHPRLEPEPSWVNNIVRQAGLMGIPVFLKNNLGFPKPMQNFPQEEVS